MTEPTLRTTFATTRPQGLRYERKAREQTLEQIYKGVEGEEDS